METTARYTNEMRERAVRVVAEVRSEHPHETAALRHVAGLLGMNTETLRLWVHRAEVEAGKRPGTTSDKAEGSSGSGARSPSYVARTKNLKSASVFLAKELDRPTTT